MWWWLERHVPGVLKTERLIWPWVLAPRATWRNVQWTRNRPKPGDYVRVHGSYIHQVIWVASDKDTLYFEDGTSCSWLNCCDPVTPIAMKGRNR